MVPKMYKYLTFLTQVNDWRNCFRSLRFLLVWHEAQSFWNVITLLFKIRHSIDNSQMVLTMQWWLQMIYVTKQQQKKKAY